MKYLICVILFISSVKLLSQNSNLPRPDEVFDKDGKVKPKGKLKPILNLDADWVVLLPDFKNQENRVEYMKNNMDFSCLKGKVYQNSASQIMCPNNSIYDFGIKTNPSGKIIAEKAALDGSILTIKMSETSLFVFLFNNMCDEKREHNGKVFVTFFNYEYGEVKKSSIKSFEALKNRLYPKNNIYTEELVVGQMKFTIENRSNFTYLKLGEQSIKIEDKDFFKQGSN